MRAGSSGWFLVTKLWSTSPFFIMWLLIFQKSHSLNHIYKNITELYLYGKKIGLVTYDLSLSIFSVPINSIILSFFFSCTGRDKEKKRKEGKQKPYHDSLSRLNKSNVMKLVYISLQETIQSNKAVYEEAKKLLLGGQRGEQVLNPMGFYLWSGGTVTNSLSVRTLFSTKSAVQAAEDKLSFTGWQTLPWQSRNTCLASFSLPPSLFLSHSFTHIHTHKWSAASPTTTIIGQLFCRLLHNIFNRVKFIWNIVFFPCFMNNWTREFGRKPHNPYSFFVSQVSLIPQINLL